MLKKTFLITFLVSFHICLTNIPRAIFQTYQTINNLLIQERTKRVQSRFYTVNFMWINRSLNTDQQFITPAVDKHELQEKDLQGVLKWAEKTQYGLVTLWYDSAVTTQKAVEKTKQVIQNSESLWSRLLGKRAPIQMRDVRTLEYVKNNPEAFSEELPVYFRADLLRVVATVERLEKERYPYFVYNDLDIEDTFNHKELFDPQTQEYLRKYGIVCREYGHRFENQFHIVSKHKKNLLEALKWAIIELNIARAQYIVQNNYDTRYLRLPEMVYCSYQFMFRYFYALEGYGTLINTYTKKPYNKNRDGLKSFGIPELDIDTLALMVKDKNSPIRHPRSDNRVEEYYIVPWVPTKEVNFPPMKGNYT